MEHNERTRDRIVVLDFGSQYAHLIAKRLRLLGYYAEIALPSSPVEDLRDARGIVLSGGPASVYDENVPECNGGVFALDVPMLGLCYGHQLMAAHYGGRVQRGRTGEFGIAELLPAEDPPENPLFAGIPLPAQVWMSHQDEVTVLPPGFRVFARTRDCAAAALVNSKLRRFSLQFHIEVKDTPSGGKILENFARLCGMEPVWKADSVLEGILADIREQAGDKSVLLFLSGGVDSTVAFALLNRALGTERVLGLHIDNGFMRKNESAVIAERYKSFGFSNFITEDASETFLRAIAAETDPQKKRAAVGETFIRVRDTVAARLGLESGAWLLAQGTLYPDIIESGGTRNSRTIKTHHNRVQGIQALIDQGLIIEPLRDLYKDEVRLLGKKLGLPDDFVFRHPFPGPGLSINVLCSRGPAGVSKEDRDEYEGALRGVGAFPVQDFFPKEAQAAVSVLPVKSVGVQGDFRTYRFPGVISFSTGPRGGLDFVAAPGAWDALEKAASSLANSVPGVNRAVLELYRRPGADLALQEAYCGKRRLDQTREVDAVVLGELKSSGWYNKIFQHLTINLPLGSTPEQGAFVLRPVVSEDVMTARFARLPPAVVERILSRITALPFVDAVYYDLTNKPPATFGWE
ncbi:MAG: glutamine-hydrolyzing GMP synthase [Spirochaetaceae bacterium]|jgi:GMP synthase (glutamine-hydrolysing)|nr:glutamine-hydrolyzing GMP synthase [Spirochaetaceae bacterium]